MADAGLINGGGGRTPQARIEAPSAPRGRLWGMGYPSHWGMGLCSLSGIFFLNLDLKYSTCGIFWELISSSVNWLKCNLIWYAAWFA